jgi:hypothetical protein
VNKDALALSVVFLNAFIIGIIRLIEGEERIRKWKYNNIILIYKHQKPLIGLPK